MHSEAFTLGVIVGYPTIFEVSGIPQFQRKPSRSAIRTREKTLHTQEVYKFYEHLEGFLKPGYPKKIQFTRSLYWNLWFWMEFWGSPIVRIPHKNLHTPLTCFGVKTPRKLQNPAQTQPAFLRLSGWDCKSWNTCTATKTFQPYHQLCVVKGVDLNPSINQPTNGNLGHQCSLQSKHSNSCPHRIQSRVMCLNPKMPTKNGMFMGKIR